MTDTNITKTVIFPASPEIIWACLTQKDKLAQWFHAPQADLKEGQDYTMLSIGDDGVAAPKIWGHVLQSDAPNRLVYTFIIGPFGTAETKVTWLLEAVAKGTRLTLTHTGISEAAGQAATHMLSTLDQGWDRHLDDLGKSAI